MPLNFYNFNKKLSEAYQLESLVHMAFNKSASPSGAVVAPRSKIYPLYPSQVDLHN